MRRADSICRAAVATTRRKQLARLVEALELMVNAPARLAAPLRFQAVRQLDSYVLPFFRFHRSRQQRRRRSYPF